MNGERTELIVCRADQLEKVRACILASDERLRASILVVNSPSDTA
jgi:hypothetical protein